MPLASSSRLSLCHRWCLERNEIKEVPWGLRAGDRS